MLTGRSSRQVLLALAAVLLLAGAATAAYRVSERAGMDELSGDAQHRLDLFAAAIDGIVNRYAHVPSTIPLNPDVIALLRAPDNLALRRGVNEYLERFNASIGSIAIYVMSREGAVLASSNWRQPDSFVGENLSFRPYFETAMRGVPARYYAVGTTRGEPGYYVSHPVHDFGGAAGVAVIKIGLGPLQQAWLPAETPALIADGNGVVILASVPEWRLKALRPLTDAQRAEIERSRQYNLRPLGTFPVMLDQTGNVSQVVRIPQGAMPQGAGDYLALSRHLHDSGWRLTVFSDLAPVRAQAWKAVALTGTGMASLLLAALFLNMRRRAIRQRLEAQAMLERANASLERKVAERTSDLLEANERLRQEVHERERAETTLRAAQDELVQAAKLAVLGQLATGITHELTQPLGAVRTLSANAVEFMRRGDQTTLEKNLTIIGGLVDRMGAIIGPLKSFARKSPASPEAVDIALPVANALFLLDQRLRHAGVTVVNGCEAGALMAWCEPIRLEQVLVNLIGNAIDAMADTPEPRLTLTAENGGLRGVLIHVADTGAGLPPEARERIFEPFYTTKPRGEGLGLGLAISRDICRGFGGNLSARGGGGQGAEFVIELPAPPQGQAAMV